jgi:hypothetical protein
MRPGWLSSASGVDRLVSAIGSVTARRRRPADSAGHRRRPLGQFRAPASLAGQGHGRAPVSSPAIYWTAGT